MTTEPGNKSRHWMCEFLREQRMEAGLSQRQVAKLAEIAQSSICAYENGKEMPAVDSMERWANALAHTLTLAPSW